VKNNIYRVEIQYTDPQFAGQRPSVIFFRCERAEVAAYGAKQHMNKALLDGGFAEGSVQYNISVYASTEEEAAEYKQQMGYRSN
jgi:hypothetical protein